MKSSRIWKRDELIPALDLYCRIPFGKIHSTNPQIVDLAKKLGRTAAAVSMKMCNFASFDPTHKKRNIQGLKHAGKQDREVWDEFCLNWESLALASQQIIESLGITITKYPDEFEYDALKETEMLRTQKVRIIQRFFREAVLSSYNYQCSVCSLSLPVLLNASHIIPWSKDKSQRANPRNGISMCALHDRAFDRGFITVQEDFKIAVSREIKTPNASKLHRVGLLEIEGEKINLPDRFGPDPIALAYHREKIFLQ